MKKNKRDNDRLGELLGGKTPADDFEKEALEGFSQLGDEASRELKAEVDAAMEETLLKPASGRRTLWLAAAALVLLIGFSVYMVDDVADTGEAPLAFEQRNEVVTPANPPSGSSPATVAGQATMEPAPLPEKKSVAGSAIESSLASGSGAETEDKTGEALADERHPAREEPAPDEMSKTAGAEPPPAITAAPLMQGAKSADILPPAAAYETTEVQTAKSKKKRQSAGKREAAAETPRAPAPVPYIDADYPGGHDSLCAALWRRLSISARKFDALLYIDENGVVNEAAVTQRFGMTDKEKETIEKNLTGLPGFVLKPAPALGTRAEYKLKCRP